MLGGVPDCQRDAPAAAQHTAGLAQRSGRIDHQHVAPAAEHDVHACQLEIDPLAAEHAVGHIGEAEIGPAGPRQLEHRLGLIAADQLAAGLDQLRRQEPDLARTCREVEHALARRERRGVDHPRGDRSARLAPGRELAPPAGRRGLPALEALAALGVVVTPDGQRI